MNPVQHYTAEGRHAAPKYACAIAALLLCCIVLFGCDRTPPGDDVTDQAAETSEVTTAEPAEGLTEDRSEAPTEEDTAAEPEETTEEPTEENTTADPNAPDERPADKDCYKSETKLFNKSTMLSANEFEGEFNSVYFKNHGLMLMPGATEGSFVSDEIDLGGPFRNMLASWNASSAGGTVEISVSVKLDDGSFTGWYSWGEWSAIPETSGSKSTKDAYGEVGIDILTLKKECQGIVKFRVDIRQLGDLSPIVYNVTLACDKENSALKAPADTYKKLDVPYRRQQDVPEIGGSICSATSLSMVLLYHGEENLDVADVAWSVRDYGEGIFGNWAFNVAHAGERGYNAYIDYFDIDAIKYAISTGHPIVSSIRVKAGQLSASGYPGYSTNGHLICVVGYEEKNGQKWLLINDPAHPEVKAILESDFRTIYRGVSYIVQKRPDVPLAE